MRKPIIALTAVMVLLAFGSEQPAISGPSGNDDFSFAIVETGQSICYDSLDEITCSQPGERFYGQDAQYTGNQQSYVDNGDGTVADVTSGLMWQQTPGDKVTFSVAVAAADTFSLAGYDDWRLPTIKELYSLIDFRGIDPSGWPGTDTSLMVPFIDKNYFDFQYGDVNAGERIIDAQYWSSNEYVGTIFGGDAGIFGVNFADGRIKCYPRDIGPGGQPMTEFVRYVRGDTMYGNNGFLDNGDGTITDGPTGLMWTKTDSDSGMTWEQALSYSENLVLAGYDDWRLPNAKELQSIVDYTRSPSTTGTAAIDPVFEVSSITDEGGGTDYPFYWASTTHANWTATPGNFGAYVAFGTAYGFMEMPPHSGNYQLMDVHGAGAQRSDPKVGDPADWPHGHGPQGDVIRIYNYIRCVRDAGALNQPPVIDPIGSQTVCLGEIVTIVVSAMDPDGDDLFWSVSGLPAGATFVDNGDGTGTLTWTPLDLGTFCMTFYVTDGMLMDSALVCIEVIDCQPPIICGDADGSSLVDIDDAVYLINYIFGGGPPPDPLEIGDVDCSGSIDIDDVVYLINYIFAGGSAPCDTDGNGEPDC